VQLVLEILDITQVAVAVQSQEQQRLLLVDLAAEVEEEILLFFHLSLEQQIRAVVAGAVSETARLEAQELLLLGGQYESLCRTRCNQ
jgi:hypothetical protein